MILIDNTDEIDYTNRSFLKIYVYGNNRAIDHCYSEYHLCKDGPLHINSKNVYNRSRVYK